jgi:AcrR family transcriptional regulator
MKETKEHIRSISFRLFLQKSFKEVTMQEIVDKTGMSKGAFYHYYKSKEEIFLEVLDSAFSSIINIDYSGFSKDSLYDFYHDYIAFLNRKYVEFQGLYEGSDSFDLNYYSLIFDGIRLFPEFKRKMVDSTRVELDSWRRIVHTARKMGEIESPMNNDQIAMIFINTSGGIGMNDMIAGATEDTTKSMLALWNAFYGQIKK